MRPWSLELVELKAHILDIYTFTALIHGFCMDRNMDEAARLFDKMIDSSIVPNEVTFNA